MPEFNDPLVSDLDLPAVPLRFVFTSTSPSCTYLSSSSFDSPTGNAREGAADEELKGDPKPVAPTADPSPAAFTPESSVDHPHNLDLTPEEVGANVEAVNAWYDGQPIPPNDQAIGSSDLFSTSWFCSRCHKILNPRARTGTRRTSDKSYGADAARGGRR